MEDKDIKDGIDRYIGTEKLFSHQLKNQILTNVGKSKPPKGITRLNKFKPAFVLLLLVFGGFTYFFISNDAAYNLITSNKGVNEEPSEITFDVEIHGNNFPELQSNLNEVLNSLVGITDSVNGVSINEEGSVVVDLKDFRKDLGSLTTNETGEFLWPLYDTVFKYPQVKEVYFTFESSFTAWYEWLESTPDPMTRQTDQVQDNTSRLVDALVTTHTYYSDMYSYIQEADMPDEQAGNVFILYLEALKNGDVEQIADYSVSNDMNQIESLVSIYEQIDYDSFTIEEIIPSQGEPIYDIHLNYFKKDGRSGTRVLYMQFYDSKISIFDSPEN